MNLHRAKKADWQKVSPEQYNSFQKLAAATNGFLTPANVITVIGLSIVIYGLVIILQGYFLGGLLLLAAGRLLDVVDGVVAEFTKTKSPIGEIFDAAADKAGTILTILVLFFAGVGEWWLIAALIIPQIVILIVVYLKQRQNIRVHPTRQGKLSMALAWVGVVALLVNKELGGYIPLQAAVYVIIFVSLALGGYAIWQYTNGKNQD